MLSRTLVALIAAVATMAPGSTPSPGDAAFKAGDFTAAARLYASALAANPRDADAALGVATMQLYDNRLDAALASFGRAQSLDPANPLPARRAHAIGDRRGGPNDYAIERSARVSHVPFVTSTPLPVIHAAINGHPVALMIDTGGANIDLSPDTVRRLQLPLEKGGTGVFAGGRTAQIMTSHIDTVEFPGLRVRGVPANILPGPLEVGGKNVDGVVGTIFLSHFLASIDYARNELTLRAKSDAPAFERALPADATVARMWLVGDHFVFTQAAAGSNKPALFNVDTGGGGVGVQLTKAQLDAANITPDASRADSFQGGGGSVRTLPFSATISLGSLQRERVPGTYFPDGDQYGIFPFAVAGTLSDLFFRPGTLTFDFDAMKIIVVPGNSNA